MAAVWQQIIFLRFPFDAWLKASYGYRVFGVLHPWQGGSWLLQWAEPLGGLLLCLLLGSAPFNSKIITTVPSPSKNTENAPTDSIHTQDGNQ